MDEEATDERKKGRLFLAPDLMLFAAMALALSSVFV
jgi:hypothetical protein